MFHLEKLLDSISSISKINDLSKAFTMTSFHKATSFHPSVRGTKLKNNLACISSGIPSLDFIIGKFYDFILKSYNSCHVPIACIFCPNRLFLIYSISGGGLPAGSLFLVGELFVPIYGKMFINTYCTKYNFNLCIFRRGCAR